MDINFKIFVCNVSGASDTFVGTRAEIDAWLAEWDTPLTITADVRDADGKNVAGKSTNCTTLIWKA